MLKHLKFLKSVRFWKLTAASIVILLDLLGALPSEVSTPLLVWLLGSVGIRTVDRFGDKLAGA